MIRWNNNGRKRKGGYSKHPPFFMTIPICNRRCWNKFSMTRNGRATLQQKAENDGEKHSTMLWQRDDIQTFLLPLSSNLNGYNHDRY
jgi:hypothetical protein